MKTKFFLVLIISLIFTACTTAIESSQENSTCSEIKELKEKASNGLFLLDLNIEEPTVDTAIIIGEPLINFDDIERVEIYPDENNELEIQFTIDFDVGLQLSGITQSHISEYMALVVDDKVVIVSQIQAALGGNFRLGGFHSKQEVNEIYSKISCRISK